MITGVSLFFFVRLFVGILYAASVGAIIAYSRLTGRSWAFWHTIAPAYLAIVYTLYAHDTYYGEPVTRLQPYLSWGNFSMALTFLVIIGNHIVRHVYGGRDDR